MQRRVCGISACANRAVPLRAARGATDPRAARQPQLWRHSHATACFVCSVHGSRAATHPHSRQALFSVEDDQVQRSENPAGMFSEWDLQSHSQRHPGVGGPNPVGVPGHNAEDGVWEPGPEAAAVRAQQHGHCRDGYVDVCSLKASRFVCCVLIWNVSKWSTEPAERHVQMQTTRDSAHLEQGWDVCETGSRVLFFS